MARVLNSGSDLIPGGYASWATPDVVVDDDGRFGRSRGALAELTAHGRGPRSDIDGFACEGDGAWRRALSGVSRGHVLHEARGEVAMIWRP